MKIKESQKKNKIHKNNNNEPINPFNNFILNDLPNADDYINIINDYDSEQESQNNENLKTKELKNKNEKNKNKFRIGSKLKFNKNDEDKYKSKEKPTEIEMQTTNDIDKINGDNNGQLPPIYPYDIIKNEILPKMNLSEEIKNSFILDENLLKLQNSMSKETFYSKKTRKRGLNKSYKGIKKKRGRKKNNDPSNSLHNKNSHDNIIKKIKSKILEHLLNFINDLLNSLKEKKIINLDNIKNEKEIEKEKIIKKIDYNKVVNDMKKKNNLAFLKMTLKELLSIKISSKYSTLSKDLNKSTINELFNREKENKIINFIFNMKLGDWIDIFTYKKEITEFGFIDNEIIKEIEINFKKVDKLLEEIYDLNNENNYFSFFVCLLYNFERWFYVKKGRQRKDKKRKEEEEEK